MFLFESSVVDPVVVLYMGKDKFENEELIKYARDEGSCLGDCACD